MKIASNTGYLFYLIKLASNHLLCQLLPAEREFLTAEWACPRKAGPSACSGTGEVGKVGEAGKIGEAGKAVKAGTELAEIEFEFALEFVLAFSLTFSLFCHSDRSGGTPSVFFLLKKSRF